MRPTLLIAVAAASLAAGGAQAMTLPEAIARAESYNPTLAQARAEADGAEARLDQARAARLPSLTLSGQSGQGTSDLGGFFGFGEQDVTPRAAVAELRQPLFAGGAINAGVDRARGGLQAARAGASGARARLTADVAEVYVGARSAREMLAVNLAQLATLEEVFRQTELRFNGGEVARTDLEQARARLAEARAGRAAAEGGLALARARFRSVVGVEPDDLADPVVTSLPPNLDDAMAEAERASPAIAAAQAGLRAADAGVRFARAERAPSFALTARASSMRDQFLPGYRAEDLSVGVQGQWTLFAGGAINGRIDEALARRRAAEAQLEAARASVREAVIAGWSQAETSRLMRQAASDQVQAAEAALESVRHEVRVGQKPTLALLDAEREALSARSALISAAGAEVVAGYRLLAVLGGVS